MNATSKAIASVLRGVADNDNDDDGTSAGLLAKVEQLATRAASLGFVGDREGAAETLRNLVPLCRALGDVRIPHLYQTGTEYAASVERALAREHGPRRGR
jgi:hypothetical protein